MLGKLNELSSVILKVMAIVVIAAVVIWLIISAWGNYALAHKNNLPTPPSISKAAYQFDIKATGYSYLTDNFTTPKAGVYVLNGYYSLHGKRWEYNKGKLTLDTYYWGTITEKRRGK